MRVAQAAILTDEERTTLKRWSRGRSTPVRLMERAKMVLMASKGMLNRDNRRSDRDRQPHRGALAGTIPPEAPGGD